MVRAGRDRGRARRRAARGLVAPLLEEHARAHAALVAWAGSPEAEPLNAALSGWAAAPALANGSARPASAVAREVLAAQVERVIDHATDYRSDLEAAHALRKAGRRLRHTADAVTKPPAAVLGPDAAALGEIGSRVQSLLGDHRDALLLADHVRGSLPDDAGMRASYASLIEAAEKAADAAIAAVPERAGRAARPLSVRGAWQGAGMDQGSAS